MRFYLNNVVHPETGLVISGQASGWDNTPGDVKSLLGTTRAGTNLAFSASETAAAVTNVMIRRWVTTKFLRDGVFDPGTISYAIACLESNLMMDATFRICAVIHNPMGQARTTVGSWGASTEWPTAVTGRAGTLSGGNPRPVTKGEYLSMEVGFNAANVVATAYTGTIRGGGTATTDLAASDTGTNATTRSAWFDFPTVGLEDLWTTDPNRDQHDQLMAMAA